ncbi:hypothetical protein PVK06_030541 [Gossypium arboreum]|uniref:Uncharacterized protein n=1 Tax=Gossypium arboreum TaxID=29729 RepID=A0ABR0NP41_GOSAR|nr:hypothetical protein PVK06_030541 [Gossypium arboreum]
MIVMPTGSGRVVSAPKFKRRRVSAVRDFLPGCGRVTAPNFVLIRQITVDRLSQGSGARESLVLYVIRSAKYRKAKNMAYDATWTCNRTCGEPSP